MRYGVKAAIAMGLLLPALETYRRGFGTWRTNFTTMFEDYWAGALLLLCAWVAHRRPGKGILLLLAVWGAVTGMILIATVGQLEATVRGTNLESGNTRVLVAKLVLLAFSASGLVDAFRGASHQTADGT